MSDVSTWGSASEAIKALRQFRTQLRPREFDFPFGSTGAKGFPERFERLTFSDAAALRFELKSAHGHVIKSR